MSSVIITGNVIRLNNGKSLNIRAIDGRTLMIDTSSTAFLQKKTNEEGNIKIVIIEDKFAIKLGDEIQVRVGNVDSIYKIEYIIVSKEDKSIVLFSSLPTKTSTFLLPLLNKNKRTLKFDSYFVNAFLDNKSEHLCLLYRFTGTQLYKDFEENMITDKLCVKHIEYDPYHVIFLFRIPEEFKQDVINFQEGKYSKFSKTLRQRIWKFYGQQEGAAVLQIVKQSPELKKKLEKSLGVKLPKGAELASIPELKKEIYNIE
jgi:hypothetical protein